MSDELFIWWAYFHDQLLVFADYIGNFALSLFVVALLCYFIERINPAEKNTKYFKRDFRKELTLALMNALVLAPLLTVALAYTLLQLLHQIAPERMFDEQLNHLPLIAQIGLGLLIMDFGTYWRHRFTHNYLWPYHAFHHSAEEITWLTSLRLHPVDIVAAMVFDTVVMYFLGFNGNGIILAAVVFQIYNYYTHLNLNIVYPEPIRYIFASPHYHRWHHATDKSAYDKNFCAMFSLYDVAFGTYYHPEELPAGYGLSPREQKEVPEKLIPHLLLPIKKDFQKIFRKKS